MQNKLKEQIKDSIEILKETFDKIDVLKLAGHTSTPHTPQLVQKQELNIGNEKPILIDVSAAQIGETVRTGDAFRLRSVKFPEYELGITNKKIRDEFCYLGLRKIGDTASAGSDNWCQEVWYYIKVSSVATEIFKIPEMRL